MKNLLLLALVLPFTFACTCLEDECKLANAPQNSTSANLADSKMAKIADLNKVEGKECKFFEGKTEGTCALSDTIVIELEGNASTGYLWSYSVKSGKENIEFLSHEYILEEEGMRCGAPEINEFRFQPIKKGTCEIRMIYKRPFEKAAYKGITFKITIL